MDVVTVGESMVLFQPMQEGSLTYAPLFTQTVAGAESNVAFGLARLGKKVRWISKLGADPFGDKISSTLAGEGVDVSCVIRSNEAPTAVYFKEFKGHGDPNIYYYRRGSAASTLSEKDISINWLKNARHLHVTGITPALGIEVEAMIKKLMRTARQQGMTVSFDPNLRRKLWNEQKARETLLSMIPLCDLFMPGIEEAEFLLGAEAEKGAEAKPEAEKMDKLCQMFIDMGPKCVVMKLGSKGSVCRWGDQLVKAEGIRVERIVDTVGAGDAFAAGFLSTLLDHNISELFASNQLHQILETALDRANTMGALAIQYKGDWEGLPTLQELKNMKSGTNHITR